MNARPVGSAARAKKGAANRLPDPDCGRRKYEGKPTRASRAFKQVNNDAGPSVGPRPADEWLQGRPDHAAYIVRIANTRAMV